MTLREDIQLLLDSARHNSQFVQSKERSIGYQSALEFVLRHILPKHEAEVNTLREKLVDAEADCVRLINEKMDLLEKYVFTGDQK